MTRADAEALIARSEGRLCVQFYRRFDGSIITKDCPIGVQAIKRRVSYAWQALVSVTLTFWPGLAFIRPSQVFVLSYAEELRECWRELIRHERLWLWEHLLIKRRSR